VAIHIGTSGWSYDHWAGIVYPRGASSLERLDAYAERFDTVEVNNTFYRWPKEDVFTTWRQRTAASFMFSIKASRGLTQFRKLNDPVPWLERMDAGLKRLDGKMSVLVFQLPPRFPYNPDRLAQFLDVAPSWPRLALEFRHPSWHREETYAMLEARRRLLRHERRRSSLRPARDRPVRVYPAARPRPEPPLRRVLLRR
jgi:uncharacterized protein YecE (DUF72 family)